MTTPLFLDQDFTPTFEKISAPVKLSDSAETWQMEIASELYKQLPYLQDYAVNVILERVSPERGYAFGSAEVNNKTESPVPDQPKNYVRIPVIVKDRLLQPADVMLHNGKALPLTESRLREALFRAETFETSTRKPTDQGMVDQLYPPLRTNYGYGNAVATGVGMGGFGKQADYTGFLHKALPRTRHSAGTIAVRLRQEVGRGPRQIKVHGKQISEDVAKRRHAAASSALESAEAATKQAAKLPVWARGWGKNQTIKKNLKTIVSQSRTKTASLLEAIAPTIPEQEIDSFITKLGSDRELALMVERNPVFKKLAFDLVAAPRVSVIETAQALVDSIKPTVVQFEKLASGQVTVRWANRNAYLVKAAEAEPEEAQNMAGMDMKALPAGALMTVSTEKPKKDTLIEDIYEKVTKFGVYKVHNSDSGETLEGFVLPVIDFEMQPLDLYLWVNEQGAYSLQDEIAGAQQGLEVPELPQAEPQGDGCFYYHDQQGARALLPMTIQNSMQDENGQQSYQGDTLFGEPLVVTPTEGLEAINQLAPGHYAIPAGMLWLPLGEPINLAKTPEELEQGEAAKLAPGAVDVKSTGQDEFSAEGAPLDKVAAKDKTFLKTAAMEFLLVSMGATPFKVREKLAAARKQGTVKIAGLLPITPLSYLHAEMKKQAAAALADFPYHLRRDLVKEAAALEDSETADKILAMNFINPENIQTFADYLPELDRTSQKLAEMLIASRLGMSQIPENAVERSMKNMETVIQGLREVQQRQGVQP